MWFPVMKKTKETLLAAPEEGKTLPEFKEKLAKAENLKDDSFLLSFVDIDDEVIQIKDQYDYEYMLEQAKEIKDMKIQIKEKIQPENCAEEMQGLESFKQRVPEPDNQDHSCQQILSEEFKKSICPDPQPLETPEPMELTSNDRSFEALDIPEKIEEQQDPIGSETLDISMINSKNCPKFEVVDTKYDFSKNKPVLSTHVFVEEAEKDSKQDSRKMVFDKEALNEIMKESPTLKELNQKVELLQNLIAKGFDNIKQDLNSCKKVETLVEKSRNSAQNLAAHSWVTCDNCKAKPIKGRRFKCLICSDFDLCTSCEASNVHNHPMMVFYDPVNSKMAEQIGSLYRIRTNLKDLDKNSLKIKVLKNLAGDNYPETFYNEFVAKRKEQSLDDFIEQVVRIFG